MSTRARNVDWLLDVLEQDFDCVSLQGISREQRPAGDWRVQAIWKKGRLLRVEDPPGVVDTILGVDHTWYRRRDTGEVIRKHRRGDENPYTHPTLLQPRGADVWQEALRRGADAALASVEEHEIHGRAAIACSLPAKKGRRLRLTVDVETGLWLRATLDDQPWLAWDELRIGTMIEDSKFLGPL